MKFVMTTIREVHVVTSKNPVVKSMIFTHGNISECTFAFPDGKKHNYTYGNLIHKRPHSNISEVRYPEELTVIHTVTWYWGSWMKTVSK